MSDYLQKPMSIRQSQHLLKILMVMHDLKLISEDAFAETAPFFDDYTWDMQRYSWEAPPPQWFASGSRKRGLVDS